YAWAVEQAKAGKAVQRECWPFVYFLRWDDSEGLVWRAIVDIAPEAQDPERDHEYEHREVMLGSTTSFPGDPIWIAATDWVIVDPTWDAAGPGEAQPDFAVLVRNVGLAFF